MMENVMDEMEREILLALLLKRMRLSFGKYRPNLPSFSYPAIKTNASHDL